MIAIVTLMWLEEKIESGKKFNYINNASQPEGIDWNLVKKKCCEGESIQLSSLFIILGSFLFLNIEGTGIICGARKSSNNSALR